MNSNKKKVLVVGSGLSAYGTCLALIEKNNLLIDVLDIGLENNYPNQPNDPVPNSKPINGNYYPYGINDKRWKEKLISERITSSHSYGGFSKVYSGSILRPSDKDLIDWPRNSIPKDIDYKKVIESLNIENHNDEIDEFFLLNRKTKKENNKNIYLGQSKIAYSYDEFNKCMIPFDSSTEFTKWHLDKKINYMKGRRVLFIKQKDKGLEVNIAEINKENISKMYYDFVYLACGCVNTTAIVDRSTMGKGIRKYSIKSCPGLLGLHVNIDFINIFKRFKYRKKENYNYQLCTHFLEQKNILTSNLWSHSQIGLINNLIFDFLEKKVNKILFTFFLFTKDLFKFSNTIFHSKLGSNAILLSEVNDSQIIRIKENKSSVNLFNKLSVTFAFLLKIRTLKLIPIPLMDMIGNYLKGNQLGGWHYGGTMPMRENPIKKTDCFPNGLLKGIKNTYIVDSSSFPSIPGSTIALLTMANAYRIARKSTYLKKK